MKKTCFLFVNNTSSIQLQLKHHSFISGCVYKGQLFLQGQKFDDGCDYECECLDNVTGKYQCTEK